jgi:hypothetical protein
MKAMGRMSLCAPISDLVTGGAEIHDRLFSDSERDFVSAKVRLISRGRAGYGDIGCLLWAARRAFIQTCLSERPNKRGPHTIGWAAMS